MRITGDCWKVTICESERGWGQKVLDIELYDNYEEAKKVHDDINSKNTDSVAPDYYIFAMLDKVK